MTAKGAQRRLRCAGVCLQDENGPMAQVYDVDGHWPANFGRADKRNPLFTIYGWEEDDGEELLHVYYGLELLEVVPADRNAPSFKMLLGRLYNAGVNRRILQETFGIDLKTIQG